MQRPETALRAPVFIVVATLVVAASAISPPPVTATAAADCTVISKGRMPVDIRSDGRSPERWSIRSTLVQIEQCLETAARLVKRALRDNARPLPERLQELAATLPRESGEHPRLALSSGTELPILGGAEGLPVTVNRFFPEPDPTSGVLWMVAEQDELAGFLAGGGFDDVDLAETTVNAERDAALNTVIEESVAGTARLTSDSFVISPEGTSVQFFAGQGEFHFVCDTTELLLQDFGNPPDVIESLIGTAEADADGGGSLSAGDLDPGKQLVLLRMSCSNGEDAVTVRASTTQR